MVINGIHSCRLCYIAKHHLLLQSTASDLRKQNLLIVLSTIVIDITQLECPQLAEISLPAISCTSACHNKSKHVRALRSAYSLDQWLNFYILSLQYAKC